MHRNSYALAALAVAAVPGLVPEQTAALPAPVEGVDVAGVVGADGRRIVLTAPSSAAAGAVLERNLHVSEALQGTSLRAVIPPLLGSVRLPEAGRAVATHAPAGHRLHLDEVCADRAIAHALGQTIARIHAVPRYAAEAAGVETYTAAALRQEHRERVERARREDLLPSAIAQRWDHLLDDDDLWDFSGQFIHADLSEETLFVSEGRVSAVVGWGMAQVGDPALDLAWLIPAVDAETFDELYTGYRQELPTLPHRRLVERAQLLGEFAVLQWLLHGVDTQDEEIIKDARGMLADLDADLAQLARDEAERAYEDMTAHHTAPAGSSPAHDGRAEAGRDEGGDTVDRQQDAPR